MATTEQTLSNIALLTSVSSHHWLNSYYSTAVTNGVAFGDSIDDVRAVRAAFVARQYELDQDAAVLRASSW